jgi:hypothetical protein
MAKIAGIYVLVQISIIVVAIVAFVIWDKRYR